MGTLIESGEFQVRLHGMVRGMAQLSSWRYGQDDLMQEALIHLWRQEVECPGQSPHWYVQSCRFYLQNLLRRGRSIDSPKRFRDRMFCGGAVTEEDPFAGSSEANGTLWDELSVNDFMARLSEWLTPQERDILRCLMDGLTAREIARRLAISHTMVNRHRAHIAALAVKLGMAPPRGNREP